MRKFKNAQGETTEVRVNYRVTDKEHYVDEVPGYDYVFEIDDPVAVRDHKGFFPERHTAWYPATAPEARLNGGDSVELSFHRGNPFGENCPTGVWR